MDELAAFLPLTGVSVDQLAAFVVELQVSPRDTEFTEPWLTCRTGVTDVGQHVDGRTPQPTATYRKYSQ
jgi:hypothetical protein